MKKRLTLICFGSLMAASSHAQEFKEYFIHAGANVRVPGTSKMGMYPIIGYDKDMDKKLLVGGFSIGSSYIMPMASQFDVKTTANLSRQVYWEEPSMVNKGPLPNDMLGLIVPKTTEYYLSVAGVVHYVPREHFSIGAGLGIQQLLSSKKTLFVADTKIRNRHFRAFMLVVPVEISWKGDKMLYNIRYEAGLLNRYRNDLTAYGKNKFGLIAFEIGMRVNR